MHYHVDGGGELIYHRIKSFILQEFAVFPSMLLDLPVIIRQLLIVMTVPLWVGIAKSTPKS